MKRQWHKECRAIKQRMLSNGPGDPKACTDIIKELKKTLSGMETNWIGELTCASNTEEVLYYEYPCRILTFTAKKESYGHQ